MTVSENTCSEVEGRRRSHRGWVRQLVSWRWSCCKLLLLVCRFRWLDLRKAWYISHTYVFPSGNFELCHRKTSLKVAKFELQLTLTEGLLLALPVAAFRLASDPCPECWEDEAARGEVDLVRGEVDLLDMSFRDEGSITPEEECRPECKLEKNFNNLNQVRVHISGVTKCIKKFLTLSKSSHCDSVKKFVTHFVTPEIWSLIIVFKSPN